MTSSVRCNICHRQLKDPDAIMRGMGMTCALRNGFKRTRKLRKLRISPLFDLKEQTLGVPLFDLEGEGA